jgi:HlyD family secretion protein
MELFRKSALEKLSSPEQLDRLMTVTSPRAWIALCGIGVLLLYTLVWSIFGEIPDKVAGTGILIRGGAIYDVVAVANGRIAELKVQPGDIVSAGEVIATASSPELQLKVRDLQEQLDKSNSDDDARKAADRESSDLEKAATETEITNLQNAKQQSITMIGFLEDKVKTRAMLVNQGVLTQADLLSARSELINAQQQVASDDLQISQARARESSSENGLQERTTDRRLSKDDIRRQLAEAQSELALSGSIVSIYSGRVIELMAGQGDLVQAGTPVVSLEDLSANLGAVAFIAAGDGKKVQPGMEIRVSPATVKREEYGAMVGRIQTVADFPSTQEGINRTLHNDALDQGLAGGGPVIEVFASLEKDPATVSGYKWSSSKGPPLHVASGTLSTAEIIVGSQHPISLIIPYLKKKTGIYGGS